MASLTPIRLIQFRAAYNLPVHAAVENGTFAGGGLAVEIEYTPGSAYLVEAVRTGRCTIGHAAADDVVADVENQPGSDLFAFMGLHSGLLSLVGAPGLSHDGVIAGQAAGGGRAGQRLRLHPGEGPA